MPPRNALGGYGNALAKSSVNALAPGAEMRSYDPSMWDRARVGLNQLGQSAGGYLPFNVGDRLGETAETFALPSMLAVGMPAGAAAEEVAALTRVPGVHYTTADFDKFRLDKLGGAGDAFGTGVYSTPADFVKAKAKESVSGAYSYGDRFAPGARSIPTEHVLQKPFQVEMYPPAGSTDWAALNQNWLGPKWPHQMSPYQAHEAGLYGSREEAAKAFNDALSAHGYDGVVVNDAGVMREVMGLKPGTVKSALTGEQLFPPQR